MSMQSLGSQSVGHDLASEPQEQCRYLPSAEQKLHSPLPSWSLGITAATDADGR